MLRAASSPNIALIKYWGNRSNELRLPAGDSLSMVLDAPTVTVSAEPATRFESVSFNADGSPAPQSEKSVLRLEKHWMLCREYLHSIGRDEGVPAFVSLNIRSEIPPAIGIASSAAVFSALAEAYAGLVKGAPLSRQEVSVLGRLGSGSGARNVFGGYVALMNRGEGLGGTSVEHIADAEHWTLHDFIVVPSKKEKKVGSTEGHADATTSPLFQKRLEALPRRMQECKEAIQTKNFDALRHVTEEDALDMHRVMETQNPPLHYLSEVTHRIIGDIEELRMREKIDVLYTMDAGPTVHLICTDEARSAVEAFAAAQADCILFRAKTGTGSVRVQ